MRQVIFGEISGTGNSVGALSVIASVGRGFTLFPRLQNKR